MKTTTLTKIMAAACAMTFAVGLTACGSDTPAPPPPPSSDAPPATSTGNTGSSAMGAWDKNGDGIIVVGFAQTGSESGWRTANTQSFKDYFIPANGFDLKFGDANGDDATQKAQVRDFISQGAEVIVIQPLSNDGWEPVLKEAKDAGIPVINSDRRLQGLDQYYEFFFGSDMRGEGDRAVAWLEGYIAANNLSNSDIKIIHLQGQMGSDAQAGRTEGLEAGVQKNGWTILKQQTGEFARDKGQAAMAAILSSVQPTDFTVVWGENDDMVYGAIDAMTAVGLDPKDYIVISFDGNKSAVQMVKDGIIDAIAECNPLLGEQVGKLILRASQGEKIPSPTFSQEEVIDSTNVDAKLPIAFGS
ncbi:MAG: ABC transporter substrate-binding protein [Propionibacteriaceae bacterium]|nr:ABC transporter substrate-binding protein [Propionibacteriaceae bacterium]